MSITIEFNNPYGVYYPGGEVAGTAVLNLKESVKARSVCIHVDGRAHTHWTEQESHTHRNSDGTSTTESRTITYEATVMYATGETVVWCDSPSETKLQPGIHRFPFRFVLPVTCAPSFEGCYGYIRYQVKVEIDRKWNFNKCNRRLFTVAPTFDLNTVPQAIMPVVSSKCKKTGMVLFRHGTIGVEMRIPKMGFVPGETVVVDAVIDNGSSRPIISADIRLIQQSRYIASRNGWSCSYVGGLIATHHCPHSRHESKKVVTADKCIEVPPKSKAVVQLYLVVPPTISSFNLCPIITVEYCMELKLEAKGNVNNVLKTDNPVLIGTVPIYAMMQYAPTVPMVPGAPMTMPSAPMANAGEQPPPYPMAPGGNGQPQPAGVIPPSYEESVYGNSGTTKDMENAEAFAPRYPYYNNLPMPVPNGQAAPLPTKATAPPE